MLRPVSIIHGQRFIVVATLALLVGTGWIPATRAARIDVTFQTEEVVGVRGTFGLSLAYAPAEVLARPGGRVTLGYAPGPLPVSLVVNVLKLLGSANLVIPSWVTDAVNATAVLAGETDPWNRTIPLADTPIGRTVVQSIALVSYGGVSVYLDVTLDGQVNATLAATGGTLDRTTLVWTTWGGREANWTASSTPSAATITASFEYFVSNGYVIRFDLVGFEQSFPIASFSLGELPFSESAISRAEVVDPETAVLGLPGPAWIGIAVAGTAAGLAVGWLLGRRKGREPPVSAPGGSR